MTSVAVYARYSSDQQSEASIDDQIRLCTDYATQQQWDVIETYSDRAMSGTSMKKRIGLQKLMQDMGSGRFDIILAESLDRLSRDQEDIAGIFKRVRFRKAKLFTVADGEVSPMHVGMKGTMNAAYIDDLAAKTHRGQTGRALQGKSAGGVAYGYDVDSRFGPDGDLIRGDRSINPKESAIVQRIFEDYADGKSPLAIAISLNQEGIKAPTVKHWGASTIYGNRRRGTGIINNELYIGKQVWNRLHYVKDPDTGNRVSRENPPEDWIITPVPHLRIIKQDLWEKVKARQGAYTPNEAKKLTECHRPINLFSYLIKCGECGGGMSLISKTHIGCSCARKKRTCSNRLTIKREALEDQVLSALSEQLMDDDLYEIFCAEYTQYAQALHEQSRSKQQSYLKELETLDREHDNLAASIAKGISIEFIKPAVAENERRRKDLEETLAGIDSEPAPSIFCPDMAKRYHQKVNGLLDNLDDQETKSEAIELIRDLVDKIVLTPNPRGTGLTIDLYGNLANILTAATDLKKSNICGELSLSGTDMQDKMVAGARIIRSPTFQFAA